MKGRGKREIPEKTRRPVASSGTIPTCDNPGMIRPGTCKWALALYMVACIQKISKHRRRYGRACRHTDVERSPEKDPASDGPTDLPYQPQLPLTEVAVRSGPKCSGWTTDGYGIVAGRQGQGKREILSNLPNYGIVQACFAQAEFWESPCTEAGTWFALLGDQHSSHSSSAARVLRISVYLHGSPLCVQNWDSESEHDCSIDVGNRKGCRFYYFSRFDLWKVGPLNIPKPETVTDALGPLPHVFVADEAFGISVNVMRPYPGSHLTDPKESSTIG
ncbi:hypothetical protein PR048_007821 [Dryococelus australis]|uniref:DDE Tnp4 domain-containing protein n=1 Tax=Dryococelus australis TaxID=614101 RepID=A0ABQ9HVC0_9NEOP|nr:hypothetical protein PR048_007821 [Dryococelus australis]